jgi:HEAT repeat protein
MSSLFLAIALAVAQAGPGKDPAQDQIDEFKKFYRPNRTVHEKVEAIHVLEKLDRPDATELLLTACGDPQFPVREAALQVLATYSSDPVRELLRKVAADDKGNKNGRRSGAIQTLGALHDATAVDALVKALTVKEFEVERAAVVALGRIGDARAVEPVAKLLADPEPALRTVALEALGALNRPDLTVTAMVALLEDKEWQVRAAAIQALGRLRVKETIGPLLAAFHKEDGRLRADLVQALQTTTAEDFGEEPDGWQRWWDGVKDRWQVPTDAELQKRKEIREKNNANYARKPETEFVGVPTKSRRLVFLVDCSGSMEELIAEPKNFKLKDRGYKSFAKLDIVKDELARTIQGLGPEVHFNLVTFATDVKPWKSGLVQANIVNKDAAVKYVQSLKAIGGASQAFNQRSGLTGTAGNSSGKTNTYAALMSALESGGGSAKPSPSTGGYDKNYDAPVDTIYFLSDGVPSTGEYVEKDDILSEVRRVNTLRKIVLNTVAIGEMDHALMVELAQQNNGTFVDLGK